MQVVTDLAPAKVGPPITDDGGWISSAELLPPVGQPVLAIISAWQIEGHAHQRGCPRVGVAMRQDDMSWLSCWPVGGSRWRAVVMAWLPIPGVRYAPSPADPAQGPDIVAQVYQYVDKIISLGDQFGDQPEIRKALADAVSEIDLALGSIKRAGQPAQPGETVEKLGLGDFGL